MIKYNLQKTIKKKFKIPLKCRLIRFFKGNNTVPTNIAHKIGVRNIYSSW